MAQLYRDQYEHWINTATTTGSTTNPKYVREGVGVEALSVAFNPQKDTYKTILNRTSQTTFNNYELSSSVSDKRCYSEDEIYDYLDGLRRNATAGETQLVEINTAKSVSTGVYEAVQYNVLITINEWLGENATISYDIDYSNPVQGTATIGGSGGISFTPTTSL
ncbi:MAG: hypothetical protein J6T74_01250 [Clostridia bacterium]|nr:hypothetical protein [Clostridia bacterium]